MKPEVTTTFQMKIIRHGESQSIKGIKNNTPESIPPKVKSPDILDKSLNISFMFVQRCREKYRKSVHLNYIKDI